MRKKECAGCQWWTVLSDRQLSGKGLGDCRRHAPITVLRGSPDGGKIVTRFPITRAVEFCGDWEDRS